MNRQIKFRAKTTANGHWVYGSLVDYGNNTMAIVNKKSNPWVIPSSVGQFTGLTDKNGTEIYEGDIITLDTWKGKHVVMFVDGAFCFKEIGVDTYCNDIHYTHHAGRKQAQVIGNIHDNPIEE